MRYWLALDFLMCHCQLSSLQPLSLDHFSEYLGCTRRNAQLVIKRLEQDLWIEWQPGIGRGNFPQVRLLQSPKEAIEQQANQLLKQNKLDQAIQLLRGTDRQKLLASYLQQHQNEKEALDVLKVPFYRGTHSLEPTQLARRTEVHLSRYLYSRLLQVDEQHQQVCGDLALQWWRDGKSWVVVLRKGITFHNNEAITAHHIQAHFEQLRNTEHCNRYLFQLIDEVTVIDQKTLKFSSHLMPELIPKLLAHSAGGITAYSEKGKTLYSGSFYLSEQTEWRTRLTANPHYHGYRPWLDAVEVWNVGDKATNFELNSDLVCCHGLSSEAKQDFQHLVQWEKGNTYCALNHYHHPWLRKKANRIALMAFFQQLPLNPLLNRTDYKKADSMLLEASPTSLPENPLRLETLVDTPPLQILTYQLDDHIDTAWYLSKKLDDIGVKSQVQVVSFPEFDQGDLVQKADVLVSGSVFGTDLEMDWIEFFLTTSVFRCCFSKKEMAWLTDKVVESMHSADLSVRLKALRAIEKQLIQRGDYLPIFHIKQQMGVRDNLSGGELLANGWLDFNSISF